MAIQIAQQSVQRYQEMCARVAQFKDKLDCEVDGGIFETVVMLNLAGITTFQSCEGHLDHGALYPWVTVIDVEQDRLFNRRWLTVCELEEQAKEANTPEAHDRWLAADTQLRLTVAQYQQNNPFYPQVAHLLDTFYERKGTPGPCRLLIERFKSPTLLRIQPGFAEMAKELPEVLKARYLKRGQTEMQQFTAFLKQCLNL